MELGRNKMHALSPNIQSSIATGKPSYKRAWVFPQRVERQLKCNIARRHKGLKQVGTIISIGDSSPAHGDSSG